MNRPAVLALFAVAAVAACVRAPAPSTPPAAPAPAPAPPPPAAKPTPQPPQSESDWRRAAAQHIHGVNAAKVFEGRPPHPLKAVVVLELTVGADGRIQRLSVLRTPAHARDLGDEAVRTVHAAAPLPPPPRALLSHGNYRFTETWLFRQDNRFQLRTLAQTQLLDLPEPSAEKGRQP